jgi:hypothetical protein
VIPREALAGAELRLGPVTVLAPVVVPREEEGVGDLAAEFAGTWTNLTRRMMAGFGIEIRGLLMGSPVSASTISALPSMTSRRARLTGTMVNGSKDAFSARQRTIDSTG